jgi:hypothetical protein
VLGIELSSSMVAGAESNFRMKLLNNSKSPRRRRSRLRRRTNSKFKTLQRLFAFPTFLNHLFLAAMASPIQSLANNIELSEGPIHDVVDNIYFEPDSGMQSEIREAAPILAPVVSKRLSHSVCFSFLLSV